MFKLYSLRISIITLYKPKHVVFCTNTKIIQHIKHMKHEIMQYLKNQQLFKNEKCFPFFKNPLKICNKIGYW